MVVLSANGVSKSFGERMLFDNVCFEIKDNEKIGLIGANGAGKTTLFKLITGELRPDSGEFIRAKDIKIGYMEQMVAAKDSRSAYDAILDVFSHLINMEQELETLTARLNVDHSEEAITKHHALFERFEREGGLTYKSRAKSTLIGLGFDENQIELPLTVLSGGQLSKISLARLLLSGADLLLLDEPTNHLDILSTEWLEAYLRSYKGAALIISHDRYFLDAVTTRTNEIQNSRLSTFEGGYSLFMQKKAELRLAEQHAYEIAMREIERLEAVIKQQHQWNREKNIKTADSKQKQVDKLREGLVKPESDPQEIHFNFASQRVGANEVISADKLHAQFDERVLYNDVSFTVMRGERIFLLGENGCGKTTLLRQIMEAGSNIQFGSGVKVGYFDQTQRTLSQNKTAIDEVWDEYKTLSQTQIRNALAVFSFRGDDVFKRVSELSGGERARIAILKLMLSGANFLLLDEPTNHLDLYSRQSLEDALYEYDGTMLIVSHDRRFINRLADKIFVMENGKVTIFDGNYDYYINHREESMPQIKQQKTVGAGGMGYKAKKEYESRIRKIKSRIAAIENESGEIDAEIAELNQQLSNPETASDYQKTIELAALIAKKSKQQGDLLDEWAELNATLEAEENQEEEL